MSKPSNPKPAKKAKLAAALKRNMARRKQRGANEPSPAQGAGNAGSTPAAVNK